MGTLILVRHGRTKANADGILAGRTPGITLDEVGRESIQKLRERINTLNVSHVVSSPLERTQETAKLLFPNHEHQIHQDLIECEYGEWTGRKLSELKDEPLFKTVLAKPAEVVFPNGEAMQAMSDRAIAAVHELDTEFSKLTGDDVIWAAVSHGDIIKAIVANALGLELNKFQKIYVEPASVSVIRYSRDDSGAIDSSLLKVNETGDSWISQLAKVSEPTLGGQSGNNE